MKLRKLKNAHNFAHHEQQKQPEPHQHKTQRRALQQPKDEGNIISETQIEEEINKHLILYDAMNPFLRPKLPKLHFHKNANIIIQIK